MDACRIAGLEVERIINEPTAAAIAYGLNEMQESMKRVFVFDLGGGTFDVSVLQIEDGVIEVLATRGDSYLGGADIDEALVLHCFNDLKKKFGVDLTKNKRTLSRLRKQCEKAKHELSFRKEVFIECEAITSEIDFSMRLSRAEFE